MVVSKTRNGVTGNGVTRNCVTGIFFHLCFFLLLLFNLLHPAKNVCYCYHYLLIWIYRSSCNLAIPARFVNPLPCFYVFHLACREGNKIVFTRL